MLLALMTGLRVLFVLYNLDQLPSGTSDQWLSAWLGGLLFDFIFCWYAFLPLLFISWFEDKSPWLEFTGKFYTLFVSFVAIVLSAIDTLFYPFSKVRTGAELLNMGGDNNISIWVYILDYWWAAIIILILTGLIGWSYPRLNQNTPTRFKHVLFLLMIPIGFFISRGGVRLKPLHFTDAILFAPNGPWPVVLNSGLVFAQSYLDDDGKVFGYVFTDVSPDSADLQQFNSKPSQPNICILILESFGKEYTGLNGLGRPSYTPFLDSLITRSLYFPHFYANGLKSMDAVPAIFASIPALFNKPFITSSAAGGRFTGLAGCLKKSGYESAFFHGADQGSMGFKPFLLRSGFDRYYSKEDFVGDPQDYDGQWGIFDEPFLQYSIQKMDQMKEPFLTSIFTLSSHHPYTIPKKYSQQLAEGSLPIHRSIRYADMALKHFFEEASKHDWFNNTLFIITADHSAMNETARFQNPAGRYEIPLLIYSPSQSLTGISEKTGQHIDLMPTVLDWAGYPYPFISSGRSLTDSSQTGRAFQYFQGNFNYIEKDKLLITNENNISGYYLLSEDPDLTDNKTSSHTHSVSLLFENMKKSVGSFQQRIIQNRLVE